MYTKEMEAVVRDASPMDFEGAKAVGLEIGMSARSVVAKAKSLGLEYISKPVPARKPKPETKVEIVSDLSGLVGFSLEGLEKSPRGILIALRAKLEADEG